jgi:hypothetical protein
MLKVPVLLAGLLAMPVADSVWWRVNGGSVVEHRDQASASCTLSIYNDQGRFAFVWDRSLPAHVMVTRQGWTLSADQITTVSMRIGDVWLAAATAHPTWPR